MWRRGSGCGTGGLLAGMALTGLAGRAEAGDLPVKAPPPRGDGRLRLEWVLSRRAHRLCRWNFGLVGDVDRRRRAADRRRARFFQRLRRLQGNRQLLRGLPGRLQLHVAVALALRRRGRCVISEYGRRHGDVFFAGGRRSPVIPNRSSFPARCAAASATRQSRRKRPLAVLRHRRTSPGASTNSPARSSPAAGGGTRGYGGKSVHGAARSAARPAPASNSRCRRTGRRGSNICSPITATAA